MTTINNTATSNTVIKNTVVKNIILLHGWGCDSRIWQSILPFFESYADTTAININDYIEASLVSDKEINSDDVRKLVDTLAEQLPESCLICGWSLGGMLAAQLADHYPKKVLGLITLASNAKFIKNEDALDKETLNKNTLNEAMSNEEWPEAMPLSTFEAFFSLLKRNTKQALKRFSLLEVHGDNNAKEQLLYLQNIAVDVDPAVLEAGLDLLANMNNITTLNNIDCPTLYCFGSKDALVPVSTVPLFEARINSKSKIACLEGRGHLLHYPNETLIEYIKAFFTGFVFSRDSQNQGDEL